MAASMVSATSKNVVVNADKEENKLDWRISIRIHFFQDDQGSSLHWIVWPKIISWEFWFRSWICKICFESTSTSFAAKSKLEKWNLFCKKVLCCHKNPSATRSLHQFLKGLLRIRRRQCVPPHRHNTRGKFWKCKIKTTRRKRLLIRKLLGDPSLPILIARRENVCSDRRPTPPSLRRG